MMQHTGSKKRQHKLVRIAIGVPEAFNALSAIGYGIARLPGTYKDGVLIEAGGKARFPLEWLQNTPFSDYTVPALLLTIGVGGEFAHRRRAGLDIPRRGHPRVCGCWTRHGRVYCRRGSDAQAGNLLDPGSVPWAWPDDIRAGYLPLDGWASPPSLANHTHLRRQKGHSHV